MPELAGKAKRVAGVFVFMIGAGFILDRHAVWAGAVAMVIGAAAFVWGMLEAQARVLETRDAAVADSQAAARPAPTTQPTESHS